MRHDDVFEPLEPPPFGLERLRARMQDEGVSWSRRLVLASALAAVVVTLVAWPRSEAVDVVGLVANTSAGALVGARALEPVVGLGATAALPVPSSNADVVIYRVSSLEAPSERVTSP